jgi:hypothetical protein
MNHGFSAVRSKRDVKVRLSMYRRAGHEDMRAGLGFRREYETWPEEGQRAYENGRAIAVNIVAAGLKLPVWRVNVTRPKGMAALALRARDIVGPAQLVPGRHMPPA